MIKAWTDPNLDFIPYEVTGGPCHIQSELPVLIAEVINFYQYEWEYTLESSINAVKAACEYGIAIASLEQVDTKE